jgi:hypothetical protein
VKLRPQVPSITYQKAVSKEIADKTIGHKVSHAELKRIHEEIDAAGVIVTDPETVKADHEAGFVGTELASELRGYPKDEVEKAKKDHAERLARIAISQSEGAAAARGVNDLAGDVRGGKGEKILSRQNDQDDVARDKTRGGAKQ